MLQILFTALYVKVHTINAEYPLINLAQVSNRTVHNYGKVLEANRWHCTAIRQCPCLREGTNETHNASSEVRCVISLGSLNEIYGYIFYFYDYVLHEG